MSKIDNLPYAAWLEESLESVINSDSQAICILSRSKDGDIGAGYWNCTVVDKITFAGFVQQDAMIETLANNGYIDDGEDDDLDEEDFDDDTEDCYSE